MNPKNVPEHVRKDLEEMLGYERVDAFIRDSAPKEVFTEWCRYNGLLGSWGDKLWETMEQMREG